MLFRSLRVIGERHNCSTGAVAIAWTLCNSAVTAAIVGARKPEQLDDVVGEAELRLTGPELKQIVGLAEAA